ncbi:hypothetical protein YS40_050 [Thermus phage phiYS40]|uniref:hypothetical protein n=1 Tax=Thermus phage phiYS40 TaxID=407392 RepID=UPI0000E689A8|nr:hypothetical protein YS40_050 [Thermus phage phiYS40]ABJ91444.1 hypothetical protein YS40_050 [Thermus phage phiYS40]BAK53568.1 hypothetical protein YSP_050 [Thermus phage phiYS40]
MREVILPEIKITYIPDRKVRFYIDFEKLFNLGLHKSNLVVSFQNKNFEFSEENIFERLLFNPPPEDNIVEEFQLIVITLAIKVVEKLIVRFLESKSEYDVNYEELESKFNEIKSKYENLGFILEFETTALVPFYLFVLDVLLDVFKIGEEQ